MAAATNKQYTCSETTHSTKQVFMRAEHEDRILINRVIDNPHSEKIPNTATVLKRDITYYGPRLRIEDLTDNNQYLLTAPGPETEAMLWQKVNSNWQKIAEVSLKLDEALPKYDICPHCNEPLSTVAHRRRSVIGACKND
ncbi:hypothetical protein ACFQO4_06350 [Saliphagus sp. GCM10025334]